MRHRPAPRRPELLPRGLGEADAEKVEVDGRKEDPPAEGAPEKAGQRRGAREEERDDDAEEDPELRAEEGEVDDGLPRHRRGKEVVRLPLRQGERRVTSPEEPDERRAEEKESGGAELDDRRQLDGPWAGGRAAWGRTAGPDQDERDVRDGDGEADQVPGLGETAEPAARHVRRGADGEEDEGAGRGGTGIHPPVPVTRRKTSSRDASPAPARISSSVPSSTARPFERIRTRSQISSTRWRRCDETMTAAPARGPAHDRLLHAADAAGIDAGQRLVEDEDLRRRGGGRRR